MSKRLAIVLLVTIAASLLARRLLRPALSSEAGTVTVAQGQSYLVILGVGDTTGTVWDGSITVTGAVVQIIRGWRFTTADSVTNNASWKISTRGGPALGGQGPVQENGFIVKISQSATPVTLAITTRQGNFSFAPADVPFGTSKAFLNGRAMVMRTGTQFQLIRIRPEAQMIPVVGVVFVGSSQDVSNDQTTERLHGSTTSDWFRLESSPASSGKQAVGRPPPAATYWWRRS